MIFALRPNARVKPTCVVEPKPWQAFSAMALVERSKFGLNELLGGTLVSMDELLDVLQKMFCVEVVVWVRSEERRVGKECVIRVDLGGRRIIKKKNQQDETNR